MKKESVTCESYAKYLRNLIRFGSTPFSVEDRTEILEKILKDFGKANDDNNKFQIGRTMLKGMIKILPQMPMQIKTIQIVTILETYLKDKFLEILLREPKSMTKFYDKQIKLGELIEEKNKSIDIIVGEHITDSYNFQKMKDIESVFEEYFKIDILEGEKQSFEKLFQIRHVLVHNSGMIDKDFLSKVKTDQKENEMIKLDKKEVNEWILSVCKFINKVEDQLNSKYGLHAYLIDPEHIMPFIALKFEN